MGCGYSRRYSSWDGPRNPAHTPPAMPAEYQQLGALILGCFVLLAMLGGALYEGYMKMKRQAEIEPPKKE